MNLKLKAALIAVLFVGGFIGLSFGLGWAMFIHPHITFPLLALGIVYALYHAVLNSYRNP